METLPQIQTIISEYASPVSTIIEAPWVNVTSVNGMTGDVIVGLTLEDFQPNHHYEKNTAILHQGAIYYAKNNFTSGASFNANYWNSPECKQIQADWSVNSSSSKAYIRNKPTRLSQFINDLGVVTEDNVESIVNTKVEPFQNQINNKQDKLISGTNIKTINGVSILGSGNLTSLKTTLLKTFTIGNAIQLNDTYQKVVDLDIQIDGAYLIVLQYRISYAQAVQVNFNFVGSKSLALSTQDLSPINSVSIKSHTLVGIINSAQHISGIGVREASGIASIPASPLNWQLLMVKL